jgi:hypothetical protein
VLRDASERFCKEMLVKDRRAKGDERRRQQLARAQDELFRTMVDTAQASGRAQQPPAYVRPGEIPHPPEAISRFEDMLKALS